MCSAGCGSGSPPPRRFLRRWRAFLVPLTGLAALGAVGHPGRVGLGWGGVAAVLVGKNGLAVGAVLSLAERVPFPRMLAGLRRLGMPALLVATLYFMGR